MVRKLTVTFCSAQVQHVAVYVFYLACIDDCGLMYLQEKVSWQLVCDALDGVIHDQFPAFSVQHYIVEAIASMYTNSL